MERKPNDNEKPIQLLIKNDQLIALTNHGRIWARTEELNPARTYWTEIRFN